MKKKNLLALILVFCLLTALFTACTKKEEPDSTVSDSPSQNSESPNVTADDEEIVEINIWIPIISADESGKDAVVSAINEITEAEIGVRINLTTISFGDWSTQVNLALANREPIDIVHSLYAWVPALGTNSVMDITDLLNEYGQDIISLMGEEIISGTSIDGRVYGLSAYRQLNSNNYFIFRTDILEATGTMDALKNATTWADFEMVLETISAQVADDNLYVIGGGSYETATGSMTMEFGTSGNFTDAINTDMLGDPTYSVHTDQQGNVENRWAREELIAGFKYMADWLAKGYVYPDSYISSDAVETLVRQNSTVGMIQQTEYGAEMQKYQNCNYEMTMVKIGYQYISAAKTQGLGFFIPTSSAEPEAAMKFMNLLYTSSELMNLINWGIEGEHYVVTDGIADFPEGKDISNVGWHYMDYMLGNQFLTLPWAGGIGGANFREDALADMLESPVSVYIGLVPDISSLSTQVAAITAIVDEYHTQFANGRYNDKMYAEFLQRLDSVNIDEYLGFFQTAVDDYMK